MFSINKEGISFVLTVSDDRIKEYCIIERTIREVSNEDIHVEVLKVVLDEVGLNAFILFSNLLSNTRRLRFSMKHQVINIAAHHVRAELSSSDEQ